VVVSALEPGKPIQFNPDDHELPLCLSESPIDSNLGVPPSVLLGMRRIIAAAMFLSVAVACASALESAPGARKVPAESTTATVPPRVPPSQAAVERFRGSVSTLDAATRARMTFSWRARCPDP
jgi:hypothetical protein